ncbi:MAG: hypothetical protein AcusKO_06000 [Acuticoccus sp.]
MRGRAAHIGRRIVGRRRHDARNVGMPRARPIAANGTGGVERIGQRVPPLRQRAKLAVKHRRRTVAADTVEAHRRTGRERRKVPDVGENRRDADAAGNVGEACRRRIRQTKLAGGRVER